MKHTIYKENEFDSRALTKEFVDFLKGGLYPIVQLVEGDEELELCFRGNADSPAVMVYYNNHKMFEVLHTGLMCFNYNHARYVPTEQEAEYRKKLEHFGFSFYEKKNKKGEKSIDRASRVYSKKGPIDLEELKQITNKVLKPIYDSFFSTEEKDCYDYFKGERKEGKPELREKKDQQKLFSDMTSVKDGYFFFDMEFAQKHEDEKALQTDIESGLNNKPDMHAIRFDAEGNPVSFVFVEVKSKEAAFKGDSGLAEHVRKMKAYAPERFEARKLEAYKIMNQYAKLGLRGLTKANCFDYDRMMNLKKEILIVLTGEARGYWETYVASNSEQYEKRICKKCEYADLYSVSV